MPALLALDQSVKATGFAVMELRGPRKNATLITSGWFGAKAKAEDDRLAAFRQHVLELLLDYEPALLVWEKPTKFIGGNDRPRGVQARTLILTRLDQVLRDLAVERGIAWDTVAANTWRAKVLGRGAGHLNRTDAKDAALAFCMWSGTPVNSADQAEAICIGHWAAAYSNVLGHKVAS